jgi:hypothetical protein
VVAVQAGTSGGGGAVTKAHLASEAGIEEYRNGLGKGQVPSKEILKKLVEPSSGDGVVLESGGFEELDQVFDSGSEITTNALIRSSPSFVVPSPRLTSLARLVSRSTAMV